MIPDSVTDPDDSLRAEITALPFILDAVPEGDEDNNNNDDSLTNGLAQNEASVELVPQSVEDWELLEIHAEHMENGGLLQQVSVVSDGQILSLTVKDGDVAQVQIVATEWRNDQRCEHPCRRLVNDSTVRIKPVLRPRTVNNCGCSPPLRLSMTTNDLSPAMMDLMERTKGVSLPIIRSTTIMLNPQTFQDSFGVGPPSASTTPKLYAMVWKDSHTKHVLAEQVAIVTLQLSDLVLDGHAGEYRPSHCWNSLVVLAMTRYACQPANM